LKITILAVGTATLRYGNQTLITDSSDQNCVDKQQNKNDNSFGLRKKK
jgi:hypothetical protein